jgi:hypothetical protein
MNKDGIMFIEVSYLFSSFFKGWINEGCKPHIKIIKMFIDLISEFINTSFIISATR